MHDTDKHYSDERQTHDTRMEYVRKTRRLDIFKPMMWKLRRRHFNKLEALQARHHMEGATNTTLPSSNYLAIGGVQQIRNTTC